MVAGSTDFQSFTLGIYSMTLVNIVYAVTEPNTAVAVICLDGVDSFARVSGFDTFGCDLVTCLMGNAFAAFES